MRATPRLVKGTGAAVYVIDDPLPLNALILEPPMTLVDLEVPLPVPGLPGNGDASGDSNPEQRVVGGCSASGLETMLALVLFRRRVVHTIVRRREGAPFERQLQEDQDGAAAATRVEAWRR